MLKNSWPLIIADCNIIDNAGNEFIESIKKSKSDKYILISDCPENYRCSSFTQQAIALINKADSKAISKTLLSLNEQSFH